MSDLKIIIFFQGKFIRIHFGTKGKLASADIETCKFAFVSVIYKHIPATVHSSAAILHSAIYFIP